MKLLFLSSLLLVTWLTIVDSKLSIVSPHQLAAQFNDETIPFVLANYGNAPYGAHFVGGLALASERNGCSKIDHFQAGELQFDQNIIAVIEMGGCQATIKTRNAQLAGAKMVILVSDSNDALPENFGSAAGTDNIHIPTILIPKAEGSRLIKFIEKLPYPPLNPDDIIPIISINFPYEAKGDTVTLDFWMSSSDESGYDFLSMFARHIGQNMRAFNFTPHFVTWDCFICKRTGYKIPISDDCISSGRYCAPDPDKTGPLQGRDILLEDIRQKCAWKTNPLAWWNYIKDYNNNCRNQADIEKCSENTFGSDFAAIIQNCVSESFFTPQGGKSNDHKVDDNKILSDEKELQLEYDITEFPVLLINHKPFNGDLENIDEVMTEVCRNLLNPIGECNRYLVSLNGQSQSQSGPGAGVIVLVVIILVISGALIVFFFRRVQKRNEALEISMEANNMVSRYMAVKDVPTARDDEETETHA